MSQCGGLHKSKYSGAWQLRTVWSPRRNWGQERIGMGCWNSAVALSQILSHPSVKPLSSSIQAWNRPVPFPPFRLPFLSFNPNIHRRETFKRFLLTHNWFQMFPEVAQLSNHLQRLQGTESVSPGQNWSLSLHFFIQQIFIECLAMQSEALWGIQRCLRNCPWLEDEFSSSEDPSVRAHASEELGSCADQESDPFPDTYQFCDLWQSVELFRALVSSDREVR